MRFLSLALALLFVSGLCGQDVVEQGFGLEFAPHYGSGRIGSPDAGLVELERLDSLNSGRAGFGLGVVYTSRVNRIGFTAGIRYLETGFETDEQSQRLRPGRSFTEVGRARFISLPFELNFYQDITPKDRVFFTLGLAGHLFLDNRIQQTNFLDGVEQEQITLPDDPSEDFRRFNLSFNTGLGFDRKFNEEWSMRIEPFFQFFLQPNIRPEAGQITRNYYQLGGRLLVRRFF